MMMLESSRQEVLPSSKSNGNKIISRRLQHLDILALGTCVVVRWGTEVQYGGFRTSSCHARNNPFMHVQLYSTGIDR